MEQNYTTRELDHYFKDFREELAEIKADGKETKMQVKLTNGRVSALENWKWSITGGMAVIVLITIPLIIYIWNHSVNQSEQLSGLLKEKEIVDAR